MDSSLDSIWDEPAAVVSPNPVEEVQDIENDDEDHAPRPSKRPRQTLFLADSDDEIEASAGQVTHKAPLPQELDIDALFEDFDKDEDDPMAFKPLPARVDEAELIRQAEARVRRTMPSYTPHEVFPSSSPPRDTGSPTGKKRSGGQDKDNKDEKKAKRRLVKLDENRLLGPNGFPQLIKMTKNFKMKGKGHEATDLNRLLQTYQYWTHQLYPKTNFRDTVERVEKLCHSRRMNVSLSVWRDEAHGRHSKQKDDSDEEAGDEADQVNTEPMNTEDRDSGLSRSSPSRISSRAPSTPASGPPSESDMPPRPQPQAYAAPQSSGGLEEDEQEDFWRSMDEVGVDLSDPPPAPAIAANSSMDEDEDMWDIIDEVEKASAEKSAPPSATTAAVSSMVTEPPVNQADPDPDNWDDMYL